MDHYHIFVNLKDSSQDLAFVRAVEAYLGHLKGRRSIEGYSIARRKLGFGPAGLGEFRITIDVRDLAQLDAAFQKVATRAGVVEGLHRRVYSSVTDFVALLDRDFPDSVRRRPATRRRRA